MPKISHWIAQFVIAWTLIFALLLVVDLFGGEAFNRAWPSALAWAAISSALFIGARWRIMRRAAPCAVCDRLDRR